jgi:L-asparaginase
MKHRKLIILATGGTIAGKADDAADNIGYTAAQVGIEQLLEAIPALAASGLIISEQVSQIDSKDMSFEVWARLAARTRHFLADDDVQGIVITHGTDTLEETAYFLQLTCQPTKPVVITCAMRPATALTPDGPQNVMDAVVVARHPGACGVLAVCAGTVHSALDVQKVHPYKLDAFSSGDAGPIGYVEEGQLRLVRNWPVPQAGADYFAIEKISKWPRVEIVMSYAGANALMVQALVSQGLQGLVVAGTGNGTMHENLQAGLLDAQTAGVRVVRATRCIDGRILPLSVNAIEDSHGLSPVKARIALMLALINEEARSSTLGCA